MPNALQPLANKTLTGTTSTIDFTSITGIYKDLVLICTYTNAVASGDYIEVTLNSDTGSNYNSVYMSGNGSSASTANYNNSSLGWLTVNGGFDTTSGNMVATFFDYSTSDKDKTYLLQNGTSNRGTEVIAGRWANTAAITSLSLSSVNGWSFATGSTFALYGVIR
jgi:hypothetical protein